VAKTEFELFEEWARAKHHYQTVEALERFKTMRKTPEGLAGEPGLDAATMALIDNLQDED